MGMAVQRSAVRYVRRLCYMELARVPVPCNTTKTSVPPIIANTRPLQQEVVSAPA